MGKTNDTPAQLGSRVDVDAPTVDMQEADARDNSVDDRILNLCDFT